MSLDSIVDVSIVNTTVSVAQQGFGIPLIVDYNTRFAVDRIRYYSNLSAMVADGFVSTDAAYRAAQAVFSQNPRPTRVGIGRRLTAPTMTVDLVPVAQNSREYAVTINGVRIPITSDSSATVAEIVTALTAAINGSSVAAAVTATDGTTKLTVAADVAGTPFTLDVSSNLKRQDVTTDAGVAADLADFLLASRDWYGVVLTSKGKAEILAAAAWVEANKRLMLVSSADSDMLDPVATNDVASSLRTGNYARTAAYYHHLPHQYLDAGVFGKMLPKPPGSANWNFKNIAAVDVSALSDTATNALEAKNANYYTTVGGLNITLGGAKVAANEYLDIVIGLDWLRARIQESLFALLAGADKVPYTRAGQAMVESVIRARLRDAVAVGLLVDGSDVITLPDIDSISTAEKAARNLPDVEFAAELAGAINSMQVRGSVSV